MLGNDASPGASSAPSPEATPAPVPTPAPAAPTAADAAVVDRDFSGYQKARRAERAGKPLAPPPVATAPAPTGSSAASTDAQPLSPASEPGAPSKPAGHGGNAETRIQELVRKNKDLERQLATRAGTPAAPPQTPPTASSAVPSGAATSEPRPNPDDAAKYPQGPYDPQYIADLGAWGARQETRRLQEERDDRTRAEADTAAARERFQGFRDRVDAAKAADPEFVTKLSPEVKALRPLSSLTREERAALVQSGDTGSLAAAAVMEEVLGSDASASLLLHFSTHPEDLARLTTLHPRQMLREFGRLEARFTSSASSSAAPLPVPVTSAAPPPPEQLGGRTTTPADPERAAVVSRDFPAFREAKRARLVAAGR